MGGAIPSPECSQASACYGSNDSTPDSRTFIDFANGSNASTQTVALTRNNTALTNPAGSAKVIWQLTTNRIGWTNAEVSFKYTTAEIAGLTETALRLYRADAIGGPWTRLASTVDPTTNRITATVSSFGFFIIRDEGRLPKESNAFLLR